MSFAGEGFLLLFEEVRLGQQEPMSQQALPSLPQVTIRRADRVFQLALSGYVRVPVRVQLLPFGSGKDPCLPPDATPVACEEPVTSLGGMTPSRPAQEQLLHQLVVLAQGGGFDDPVIVGGPSVNERIEYLDDLGLGG